MAAEASRRGAGQARQLTTWATGRLDLEPGHRSTSPRATQIVDMFHAREHLHDLGKIARVHARHRLPRLA